MPRAARAFWAALALTAAAMSGCGGRRAAIHPPNVLVSPYDASGGDTLWAVAPLANESGVGFVDAARVSDLVAGVASEARGIHTVPVNRTIAAMRALEIERITTPAQAERVAQALGVDGIVVGSVTAYDPYDPPTIGLSLALFGAPGAPGAKQGLLNDPRLFSIQAADQRALTGFDEQPESTAAVHLDARNHDVLIRLRRYAEGRSDDTSSLGWRVHTASMELYTKFAAHEAVGDLLDGEWLRLARLTAADAD